MVRAEALRPGDVEALLPLLGPCAPLVRRGVLAATHEGGWLRAAHLRAASPGESPEALVRALLWLGVAKRLAHLEVDATAAGLGPVVEAFLASAPAPAKLTVHLETRANLPAPHTRVTVVPAQALSARRASGEPVALAEGPDHAPLKAVGDTLWLLADAGAVTLLNGQALRSPEPLLLRLHPGDIVEPASGERLLICAGPTA
ncbi:MAG: hypothetical protein HY906_26295 [Deltaproteobacteria bacterium]|nr:hypothetical protein [Deltaproteobacteria bacterium]